MALECSPLQLPLPHMLGPVDMSFAHTASGVDRRPSHSTASRNF